MIRDAISYFADHQKNRGIKGRGPHLVVSAPGIKDGQIYFVADGVMKAIFKGSGQDLSVKVDRYELPLGIIIVLVSRHISPLLTKRLFMSYDQVYGDMTMLSGLFLQPKRGA